MGTESGIVVPLSGRYILNVMSRCFPHVINLAVQAIYSTLKDNSNSDIQYLLGNFPELTEEALLAMPLPDGVTIEEYHTALAADIIGMTRKLVSACRASGQRREEFELTIREGNEAGSWVDSQGNALPLPVLQLLRDCETRWSSTYLMLDRVLTLLPVCASISVLEVSHTTHRQLRHMPHVQSRWKASYHHLC